MVRLIAVLCSAVLLSGCFFFGGGGGASYKGYVQRAGMFLSSTDVDNSCISPKLRSVIASFERRFGKKIVVNSGYRDPIRNIIGGGEDSSYHMRCMAVDFGPFGIRANAVAPGYIDTRMAEQKQGTPHEHQTDWFQDICFKYGRMPLRRAGKPEDVAGPILFLASDDSLYVTGTVLVVDGGFTATY